MFCFYESLLGLKMMSVCHCINYFWDCKKHMYSAKPVPTLQWAPGMEYQENDMASAHRLLGTHSSKQAIKKDNLISS